MLIHKIQIYCGSFLFFHVSKYPVIVKSYISPGLQNAFTDKYISGVLAISLIEVLISMALLTIILTGLDAMELSALRTSRETYFFSVAANQLQIMEERMTLLAHNTSIDEQIALWNQETHAVLPNGRGLFNQSTLTVFWGNAEQNSCRQKQEGLSGCLQKRVTALE